MATDEYEDTMEWSTSIPQWGYVAANNKSGAWRVPTELYGDRVRLRTLESGDEERLYNWSNGRRERCLWPGVTGFVSVETFREQVCAAIHGDEPLFIVEGKHSGRIIGWVYADQFSSEYLVCRMHVYIIPEARSYGAGAEAALLFLDYAYGQLGMRTVVIEPLASQAYIIELARKGGFEMESASHVKRRLAIQRARWQETLLDDDACTPPYRATRLHYSRRMGHMRQPGDVFFPSDEPPQRL